MKILVTGGAGYIGSHVVKLLLEHSQHELTVLDNLVSGFQKTIDILQKIATENSHVLHFIEEDLSHFEKIEKIMCENRFDVIIHFAASIVVPESVTNPLKYYLNNTVNTANLIKCATECGVKRFIFSSTGTIYGDVENLDRGLQEDDPVKPMNPYGMSKLMSEQILKDTANAYPDFKYAALRYFNVAGADVDQRIGQSTEACTLLIKVAAETALQKRDQMYIFGGDYSTPDGTGIRDYIHVSDLAWAHIEVLQYLENHDSELFNVGYGRGFSVKEVIDTMKKISGVDFKVEVKERRAGDPTILIADNSKIINATNWKPKYDDLEIICQTTLNWEKKLNDQ